MQEIRTSGSMSGDGKRSVAAWPKLPRPSSTLPELERTGLGPHALSQKRSLFQRDCAVARKNWTRIGPHLGMRKRQ
jgi:hypothetical protein